MNPEDRIIEFRFSGGKKKEKDRYQSYTFKAHKIRQLFTSWATLSLFAALLLLLFLCPLFVAFLHFTGNLKLLIHFMDHHYHHHDGALALVVATTRKRQQQTSLARHFGRHFGRAAAVAGGAGGALVWCNNPPEITQSGWMNQKKKQRAQQVTTILNNSSWSWYYQWNRGTTTRRKPLYISREQKKNKEKKNTQSKENFFQVQIWLLMKEMINILGSSRGSDNFFFFLHAVLLLWCDLLWTYPMLAHVDWTERFTHSQQPNQVTSSQKRREELSHKKKRARSPRYSEGYSTFHLLSCFEWTFVGYLLLEETNEQQETGGR